MLSSLTLVSQTPFSAVTVRDVKTHLNITDDSWNGYLQTLLDAAVDYCERATGLDWRTTHWQLVLDQFPIWRQYGWYDRYGNQTYSYPWTAEFAIGRTTQRWQMIDLMRGPVVSVESVTYYDQANVLQTLASSAYVMRSGSFLPGFLEPVSFYPAAYPRPDAVKVAFTSGFTATSLPARGQQAIKLLVGSWWSAREDLAYGPATAHAGVGQAVDCLLGTFLPGNYT